jgi:hypothetical protein
MRKIFFGAILGAAAMYFLDPGHGAERRQMLTGLWSERKETVLEAARTTAGAVSAVTQGVGDRLNPVVPAGDSGNGSPVPSEA